MIRVSRQTLGLSQNRVSELTGELGVPVSRSAICDIERGCNLPGIESLVSLCDVLHLDLREILERIVLPTPLVGDLANCSFEQARRSASLLYWSCQYRAAATIYAALPSRLELEPPREPAELRRLRVVIELRRAACLRRAGRLQAAEAAARRSLWFAAGSEELQSESLVVLARQHLDESLLPLAAGESDQAVRLAQAAGSPGPLAFAWHIRGAYLYYAARFEEAAEAYRCARGFSIQAGDVPIQGGIEGSLGACLEDLGHPSAALRQYKIAVDLARKGGDQNGVVSWQLEFGRVQLLLDALDEAERYATAGLSIARSGDNPLTVFRGIWLQHQIARRRSSRKPDRHRVASLKRLYPRVARNTSIDAVREFRSQILGLESS